MNRSQHYHALLPALAEWDDYLLKESNLPGPRANLELVHAVADLGSAAQFARWAALSPAEAPAQTAREFLPVCGAVGLGRLLAEGDRSGLPSLRRLASDPRWRVREGVAMALQRWGDADLGALLREMRSWAKGSWLEQRAAAAALCEPRLLARPAVVGQVLRLLDNITAGVSRASPAERKHDEFKTLRQGLGYCWSVAVAALPEEGKAAMERWLTNADPDVRWIMRENLKKSRLARLDAGWVARWQR